jgi:serine/threonine protein kinase
VENRPVPAVPEEEAAHFLLEPDGTQEPVKPEEIKAAEKTRVGSPGETENQVVVDTAGLPTAAAQKKITLGDYQIIKKLGQGGMGTVYLAHQLSLDRDVALKVLSRELANKPHRVERFLREARLMAKLDHPNILRCYEVGQAMGYHYLAMEYAEGGSIGNVLAKRGKFSVGDALHIALACARALHHAHELNMIHRDIKPDNLLLSKRGEVKLADLGLARAQDDVVDLTKTGTGAGTPLYMAPEQARDAKRTDRRSDIHALGCMLYIFLTGKFPFQGETLLELVEAKEKGKFPPARQSNSEVPERLDLILDKTLAPKLEHRYQSCAELILDLESLGLMHDRLSFFAPEGPVRKSTPTPKRIAVPVTLSARSESRHTRELEKDETDIWYAAYTTPEGRAVTRKLTTKEVVDGVRDNTFNQETQLSRTRTGGYRSLGTYAEFQFLMKGPISRARAERRAEKIRGFYEKIEEDERRRQRWRFIHNLFLRVGGWVGFLMWLGIAAAVGVGLFYVGRWGLSLLAEKMGIT